MKLNKKYANAKSLVLMIVITGLTQILTLLKSSLVAGQFGVTSDMDAYSLAYSIASFVFGFVAAGISTVVIPSYVKKENKDVNSFITLLYSILAGLLLGIGIFRVPIINLFSNRGETFVKLVGDILIITLFSNYLFSISNVTSAYFQCIGKYNVPKVLNFFSQLIVVIALILFKNISIVEYSYILAIGIIFNFLIDTTIAIKFGWRYTPNFKFGSNETVRLIKLFLPIVFSTGIYKLSLLIDSTIAARLSEGKITVLSYSGQISNMINSILIGNLLIYYYPKLVRNIKEKNNQKIFWDQTSFFHLVVCLVVAGFCVIGKEVVALLFEHGKFDSSATWEVYVGSLIYIIGQQTNIVRDLIYRYFYAKEDTKTPASNSVLVSVTNIIVSLILVWKIGYYGIIIGTVFASGISLVRIFIQFCNKYGNDLAVTKIIFQFAKNIFILVATIIIVEITKGIFPIENNIVCILVYGVETVIIFCSLSLLIVKNLKEIVKNI